MSKVKVPIGIVSCTFTFDKLTKKLSEENLIAFEYNKICGWLSLIQKECMYPYKWNNPTRTGLSAKCKDIQNKEDYKLRMDELKLYVNEINGRLNINITIEKDIEKLKNK